MPATAATARRGHGHCPLHPPRDSARGCHRPPPSLAPRPPAPTLLSLSRRTASTRTAGTWPHGRRQRRRGGGAPGGGQGGDGQAPLPAEQVTGGGGAGNGRPRPRPPARQRPPAAASPTGGRFPQSTPSSPASCKLSTQPPPTPTLGTLVGPTPAPPPPPHPPRPPVGRRRLRKPLASQVRWRSRGEQLLRQRRAVRSAVGAAEEDGSEAPRGVLQQVTLNSGISNMPLLVTTDSEETLRIK